MIPGRAATLKVIETYRSLNYGLSKTEVKKFAYFLQFAGGNLSLDFKKHTFGPYADALRHALERMDGHFIRGVGDGVVEAEIEPLCDALDEANEYISSKGRKDLLNHVVRVEELIQGFQSSYGMELLSTVHWVFKEENAKTPEEATEYIHKWNSRKKNLIKQDHVKVAWDQLDQFGWLI